MFREMEDSPLWRNYAVCIYLQKKNQEVHDEIFVNRVLITLRHFKYLWAVTEINNGVYNMIPAYVGFLQKNVSLHYEEI